MSRKWLQEKCIKPNRPKPLEIKRTVCNGASKRSCNIKSAILHGKASLIQSRGGIEMTRFEHHGEEGTTVVIAEELSWRRRQTSAGSSQKDANTNERDGRYYRVISSYRADVTSPSEANGVELK